MLNPRSALFPLLCAVALGLSTNPAAAQDPTPGAVVSMQQCHPAELATMRAEFEQHWVPVLNRAVADGRLLDYGLLEHYWGDEYNQVVYYVTPDVTTAAATASSLLGEVMAVHPGDPIRMWGDRCMAHKDNIYRLVVSSASQMEERDAPPVPSLSLLPTIAGGGR